MTSTVGDYAVSGAGPARVAYPLLLALGALDATGYSVIVPVAPAIADATGAGPATIGLLVACFPAGMVIGFALAGWAVERHGARTVLATSLVLVALGALGFIVGDALAVYFPVTLVDGPRVGRNLDRRDLRHARALARSGVPLHEPHLCRLLVGGLIGPALGVFGGIHGPFIAYLGLLLAAVPLVLLLGDPATRRTFSADRTALRTRGFWLASAAILFAVLALGVLEGVLPLHFAERLTQAEIAALYVGASVVVAISAAAAAALRPRPLVIAGVFLAVAGISLAGAAAAVPLWLLALLLAGVGIGIGNTGSIACWSTQSPSNGSSPRWSSGRKSASPATSSAPCSEAPSPTALVSPTSASCQPRPACPYSPSS